MRRQKRLLKRDVPCPCGSGAVYGVCCRKKKIQWEQDARGRLHKSIKLSPRAATILDEQLIEFSDVFGRKPRGSDRIFVAMNYLHNDKDMWLQIREAVINSDVQPHLAFASERTQRILSETNIRFVPDLEIDEWEDAVNEFYALKERGIDPHMALDFSSPAEAALVIEAHSALEKATIHLGAFIERAQRRSIVDVASFFVLYFSARSFNAAKTIFKVTSDAEARELIGIARTIYECYLRVMSLRFDRRKSDIFLAQASVGNGV